MLILLPISIVILVFLVYASYSIEAGVYIKSLCKNPCKGKVVAITFDDGPDANQTPKILDVLKEYNAKACFFCIGNKIAGNENILLRIKEEDHLIGNHSYNHFFSFPLQTSQQVEEELYLCKKVIENTIKEKTIFFRPPFGITNPIIAKAIKKMNYISIGWSIRSLDTCKKEEIVLKRIKRKLKPGAVILLHDTLPESDTLLRKILEHIKESGYSVERIDKLFDIQKTII